MDQFIHGLTYWWILFKSNQGGHSFHSKSHARFGNLLSPFSIQTAALEKKKGGGNCINLSTLEKKFV